MPGGVLLLGECPDNITVVLLDVTSPPTIESALCAMAGEPLAGLVNNAGISVGWAC